MLKNNTLIWVSALLTVLIFGLIWADYRGLFNPPGQLIRTDTVMVSDTLYLHDTLTVSHPVPYEVIKTKTDTVYTPQGDTLHLVTETKKYEENIIQEQDTAKVYAEVTGINAELDTISVMFNRREVTNTVEITKYIQKKRTFWNRFNVGVQVGYGIGLKNRDFEPYFGLGVGFSF